MALDWHIGDTRSVLATLPAGSVNCVVTSPPYLAKREYLDPDHPEKQFEQGQEGSPRAFLDALLGVMDLIWDVLAADGVAFVNLGDTASGSGGAGGDYAKDGLRGGQPRYAGSAAKVRDQRDAGRPINGGTGGHGWPLAKSICWVPELFGASLAYGRNLLTGHPCQQWITRPSITWAKPNPSVGAISDKFRESTELVVMAVKQRSYWFDLDPVRTPSDYDRPNLKGHGARSISVPGQRPNHSDHRTNDKGAPPHNFQDYDGRDLPDTLTLDLDHLPAAVIGSPAQYPGAHFAVMPPWLARLLVTVGCPPGGVVLDPYGGSGTTADAAHSLGRSSTSIDLDDRNVALAQGRLGLWPLTVHDHRVPA